MNVYVKTHLPKILVLNYVNPATPNVCGVRVYFKINVLNVIQFYFDNSMLQIVYVSMAMQKIQIFVNYVIIVV